MNVMALYWANILRRTGPIIINSVDPILCYALAVQWATGTKQWSLLGPLWHHRAPGVAAVEYVSASYSLSTRGTSVSKTPLLVSGNESAHDECGRSPVVWYNVGWFRNHTLLVWHAMFTMRMGHLYWESFQSYDCLQIGASIFSVPTRDAVATGIWQFGMNSLSRLNLLKL